MSSFAPPGSDLITPTALSLNTASSSSSSSSGGSSSSPTPATSLPSSPTDKLLAVLTDSASSPTYAWEFQYSTAAACWIFKGGSWLEGTTSVTIPRAGTYYCQIGGAAQLSGGSASNVTLAITAGGITLTAMQGVGSGGTETVLASLFDAGRMSGLTTSQTLTPTVTNNGISVVRQYIRVQPVTVT